MTFLSTPEVGFTYEQSRTYRTHVITGSLTVEESVYVTVRRTFGSPDLSRDHLQFWAPASEWLTTRRRGSRSGKIQIGDLQLDLGNSPVFPTETLAQELSRYWNPLTAMFMAAQWAELDRAAFDLAVNFVRSRARMGYSDMGLGFTSASLSTIDSRLEMPHG